MPDEPKVPSGPCLEPEVLAAYVERTLTPDERARAEAHLAECGDCYALLTEVMRTIDDMDGRVESAPQESGTASGAGRPTVFRPTFGNRRKWMVAGGLFASAAALVLMFRAQPTWWQPLVPTSQQSLSLAKLVDAVGEERYVEGRLTGGFRFGPLRQITRAAEGEPNLSLLAAAGEIQKSAQADPNAGNLHALGMSYLLLGNLDLAVLNLRQAVDLSGDPRAKSDLAAAYLARATLNGRSEDLPQALSVLESAINNAPDLPEARFNKGLVLEELGLSTEARNAWTAYLALDSKSEWAEHVRTRLAALETASPRASTVETADHLMTRPFDASQVIARDSQLAREAAEDVLLPRWAEAYLENDARLAETSMVAALEIARALAAAGDPITQRAVDAIRSAPLKGRAELAQAHLAWRDGRREYATVAPSRFVPYFTRAERQFASNRSPMALWARHYLAVALYLDGRIKEGEAAAKALLRAAAAEHSPSLTGRVRWDLGSMFYQQARFGDVLTEYSEALALFSKLGERDNAAAMHQSIAETLGRLGRVDEGWRSHRQALRLVSAIRDPRRRQAVLTGAGYTALNASLPEAAVHFFREARQGAADLRDHNYLFEAEAGTGRSLVLSGREAEARVHLDAALTLESSVTNSSFRSRFGADARLALAEVAERAGEPATVIDRTDEMLPRLASVSSEYRLAHLHLMRGRAFRLLGRPADARTALETGIAHLESKRALLQQDTLRISYLDQAWDLYGELFGLLAIDLDNPREALFWAERGRARVFKESVERPAETDVISQASAGLPSDTAVLFLAATDRGLFEWLLRTDRSLVFRHQSVPAGEIEQATQTIQRTLGDTDERRRALQRLRTLVVDPLDMELGGVARLVVIPDWLTQGIPFASLQDEDGTYLVERLSISLAASLTGSVARARVTARGSPDSIAVFVASQNSQFPELPALPGAEGEARAIAAMYPRSATFRGSDVTAGNLAQAAQAFSVLHLAIHAVPDSRSTGQMSFVLSDGLLSLSGGDTLLRAPGLRLAVLAACSTQKGQKSRSEVLMSLARPFLIAGADYVLVTLWNIEDASAAELMTAFHRQLRSGVQPDAALAAAQQEMIERKRPSSWWAGFALVSR